MHANSLTSSLFIGFRNDATIVLKPNYREANHENNPTKLLPSALFIVDGAEPFLTKAETF